MVFESGFAFTNGRCATGWSSTFNAGITVTNLNNSALRGNLRTESSVAVNAVDDINTILVEGSRRCQFDSSLHSSHLHGMPKKHQMCCRYRQAFAHAVAERNIV